MNTQTSFTDYLNSFTGKSKEKAVPGSVMAMAPTISPLASLGNQRAFCSCVP